MDIFKTLLLDTPVSTSISGTVPVNQGGTGATTAADARVNLLPSYTGNANKVLSLNSGATDVEWTTNGSGTVTSVDLTAGTGISVSGGPITSTGSITVTNTAPDQTVALTAGTGISISGTYPNFTVTNSAPSLGGDVVGPASATDNAVVRFDLTTGKLIQNSGVTISDVNLLTTTSLQVNDNSTFGSSNTDTVDFVGRVASEFTPSADDTYDLGRVSHEWRDLFIDGTANIDSLVADTADINGGTIDAATIGGSTAAAGTFTTLTATTKVVTPYVDATNSAGGALRNASGVSQVQWGSGGGSNVTFDVATNLNPANASISIAPTGTGSVTINPATAGTINNMSIGATTAAAGKFTTLEATGVATVTAGTVSAPAITTSGDTNTGIFFPAADAIAFTEGGTEVFRIESNGRMGIGQTSPASKLDLSGNYASNITAMGALDVDCSTANYFTKTINGNSTFTFSNPPSSRAYAFALELTHTSGTVTWPTTVKWPKDTAPTLTAGKTHIFIFVTDDGGTRWRGAALVDYVN